MLFGGGNPIEHPDLIPFLNKLKEKQVIANMTLRDTDVLDNIKLVKELIDNNLITALGISCSDVSMTLECVKQLNNDNVVIHLICGIVKISELQRLSDESSNLKILLLGYKKNTGRGIEYYSRNKLRIEFNISNLRKLLPYFLNKFQVVSFDNLAINQLNVKKLLSEDKWNEFYMGEEGQHSMYIDLVKEKFAMNSTSKTRYPLKDDFVEMFSVIKEESRN